MSLIKCKYFVPKCEYGEKTYIGCTTNAGEGCEYAIDFSRSYEKENGFFIAINRVCGRCRLNEILLEKESDNFELRRNKNYYGENIPSSDDYDGYLKVGNKKIPLYLIDYLEINGNTIISGINDDENALVKKIFNKR